MSLSVVIPTLNRSASLARTLESLRGQDVEVVVVDNGSTDDTKAVIERFGLRHIVEPKPGASNAKNRGTAKAKGEWVAFLDDDATVEPGWSAAVRGAFSADVDAIGGRIVVEWPGRKPEWMPAEREGYYGHCDYGAHSRELKFPEFPFGSNMILRRDVLARVGGLSAAVGPTGSNMMSGGEQELFYRLAQANAKVVYEPRAVVHHWIPAKHVTKRWLFKRAYKHGMSNARVYNPAIAKAAGRALVSGLATGLAMNEKVRTARAATTAYWCGVVREAVSRSMQAPVSHAQQCEFSEALAFKERA